MFNFTKLNKYLNYFDTDRIVKIGEKVLSEPIPCHLYIEDKKTIFAQDGIQPPTYVYGELYVPIEVPVIFKNVKIEKMNPVTNKAIFTYEGTPSKPMASQSRIKYDVQFIESVEPVYPRTINVQVWDSVAEQYYNASGLTMELTDASSIVPKTGFMYDEVWGEYGDPTWIVTMVNQPLLTLEDNSSGIVKDIDTNTYYKITEKNYPDEKELIYVLTDEPKTTPRPVLNVPYTFDYWDEEKLEWVSTGGATIKAISDSEIELISGISLEQDEWGDSCLKLTNIDVCLDSMKRIYFKDTGNDGSVIEITELRSNPYYAVVKESDVIG